MEQNQVAGGQTAEGRMAAPRVLVATSVWGCDQLRSIDIDVRVFPHRAEMGFFHVPPGGSFHLRRIVSDARSMLYLLPEGNAQMFVGWREGDRVRGTDDMVAENPDEYRQTSRYASMKSMQKRRAVTLPPMADGFVHRTYACVYDYTPDAMPILDRANTLDGLFFALGFSGGGFFSWIFATPSESCQYTSQRQG